MAQMAVTLEREFFSQFCIGVQEITLVQERKLGMNIFANRSLLIIISTLWFFVLAVEKDLELMIQNSPDVQASSILLLIKPSYVCVTRHCHSSKRFY